jgi:hypothetical protein
MKLDFHLHNSVYTLFSSVLICFLRKQNADHPISHVLKSITQMTYNILILSLLLPDLYTFSEIQYESLLTRKSPLYVSAYLHSNLRHFDRHNFQHTLY